ncbi:MAG: hypothetical protein L0227_19500 [Chloroflexi bacterium]|nr:hypothetical protein [Chloroflexota bacterium]
MTIEQLAGWSAIVAAVATVVGAVFLGLFFSRGQPWGTWNDVASIVLMLATIPVAVVIAIIEAEQVGPFALIAAVIGIAGMLAAAASQALLVARVRTYDRLLPWTLGAGAVVGVWYVLAGIPALTRGLPTGMGIVMILSGLGFIAVSYGFARGGERDPAAALGFAVLGMGSTVFLAYMGLFLLSGKLVVPSWNA